MSSNFIPTETKAYGIMVLAYDIMHEEFASEFLPCDTVFDICTEIIDVFFKSEEYNNFRLSFYDALVKFVNDNRDFIDNVLGVYEILNVYEIKA